VQSAFCHIWKLSQIAISKDGHWESNMTFGNDSYFTAEEALLGRVLQVSKTEEQIN